MGSLICLCCLSMTLSQYLSVFVSVCHVQKYADNNTAERVSSVRVTRVGSVTLTDGEQWRDEGSSSTSPQPHLPFRHTGLQVLRALQCQVRP